MQDIGAFSVAKFAVVTWRAKFIPGGNGGVAEAGLEAPVTYGSDWIAWHYRPGTWTNFMCQCGADGAVTTLDSGVPGDNNDHEFTILTSPTAVQFYLDNVLRGVIATNIPTENLQPYGWVVGPTSGNAQLNADYVRVIGDR
jgi:hypothetical protein